MPNQKTDFNCDISAEGSSTNNILRIFLSIIKQENKEKHIEKYNKRNEIIFVFLLLVLTMIKWDVIFLI